MTTATTTAISTVIDVPAIDSREYKATEILTALKMRQSDAELIRTVIIELIREMETWDKKAIESDAALIRIFKEELAGDDLSRLAQWINGHSPVRAKFDQKTGRFTGLKLDPNRLKNFGKDVLDVPVWDIRGMEKTSWVDYQPERRKAPGAPSVQRALDNLVREIARAVDTDRTTTVTTAKQDIERILADIADKVDKVRSSEKHEEWVKEYKRLNNKR